MKFTIIFLALFHSAFVLNQDPVPPKYNIHSSTLCQGDTLVFGNKSVKFKKIVSDSRCPKNVTCIWAGEVKVLVAFYEAGILKGEKIIAGTNISIADYFDVDTLNINGITVSPYPEVKRKIAPEEYSVTIKITEKVESD